jgi:parallel beta-helix repeat protein
VFLATQESSDLGGGISAMRLTVPEIPPGGTAPLSVSLPAPADHPGVYYVIAQLDSAQATSVTAALVASAAAAPVSSPGSRKSAKLQVAAAPDLRVTSLTATPSSARAGATVVAKGTIRNQASVLSGSTTLRLWLTANSSLSPLAAGAAAVDLGSSPVAGIPAGSQVSFAVSVTLPAGTQPGVWYLQAMADAGSALPESDETNNLASTALTVQPDESAFGPVYYVATYGNDGNPGTESQPFRTVARGAQALTPGATLYVRSGTYAESLMNVIPGGTSWTAPVRVVAYSGETVVLRPNAGATRVLHFQGPRTAFISVEGFVLDGANVGYDAVKITYGSVPSDAAHHIRLLNCEIKNAPLQGVLVSSGADSNEFINLDVHHNGTTDFHHGFYVASQRNLIEGSTIHANSGTGIQLYYSDGVSVHDNVVRGNWVVSNASAGARGAGVSVSRGARNRIYNNVIVGNVVGIFVDYSVTDTDVYNNTLYANEDYGLYVGTGSVGADIRNNIVYASTGPNYANAGSGTAQSNNLFGVDPRFMDPTRSDYHLRADSPAVDAGMTLNLVTTDLDGVSRPQHNLSDIGAFELR